MLLFKNRRSSFPFMAHSWEICIFHSLKHCKGKYNPGDGIQNGVTHFYSFLFIVELAITQVPGAALLPWLRPCIGFCRSSPKWVSDSQQVVWTKKQIELIPPSIVAIGPVVSQICGHARKEKIWPTQSYQLVISTMARSYGCFSQQEMSARTCGMH